MAKGNNKITKGMKRIVEQNSNVELPVDLVLSAFKHNREKKERILNKG